MTRPRSDLFFFQVVADGKVPVAWLTLRLESVTQRAEHSHYREQGNICTVYTVCVCVLEFHPPAPHACSRTDALVLSCDDAATWAPVLLWVFIHKHCEHVMSSCKWPLQHKCQKQSSSLIKSIQINITNSSSCGSNKVTRYFIHSLLPFLHIVN